MADAAETFGIRFGDIATTIFPNFFSPVPQQC